MILADAEATTRVGAALAALVQGGDAVALIGELGAGKTTLVAGLVAALGAGVASSPTFALVNRYDGGRLVVWHVDLYRVARAAELPELGLDDAIGAPDAVALVEWADSWDVMPRDHLRLELAHDLRGRTLVASGTGRGGVLAAELLASLS